MKALNKITFSFLIALAIASSCQNEVISQNCEGENLKHVETFYSDEFDGSQCELQNIDISESEVTLVITTQADLDKYLTCSDQLPVDFDKYFILAGVYRHHQCAVFDSQQVLLCNGNKIIYGVRMLEQDCHAVTPVFYATVIERKYLDLSIEFDVEFNN